ncbi:hypothetical protein DFH06DRAFT_61334 [Mycena polygramma]|nr:hypothetical protein DFH06DRAFT_61334 [Mycena polygramma]
MYYETIKVRLTIFSLRIKLATNLSFSSSTRSPIRRYRGWAPFLVVSFRRCARRWSLLPRSPSLTAIGPASSVHGRLVIDPPPAFVTRPWTRSYLFLARTSTRAPFPQPRSLYVRTRRIVEPRGYVRSGSMSPDLVCARGGSVGPEFGSGNNSPMTEDELFVLPRRGSSTTGHDATRTANGQTLTPAEQTFYAGAYSAAELRTFHCERVRKMPLSGLDPRMLIGSVCRSEVWVDLRRRWVFCSPHAFPFSASFPRVPHFVSSSPFRSTPY